MIEDRPVPVGAPGAIVIGGYLAGLAVVRSLGPLGIPVAVVTTSPYDVAHRSRWCAERADLTGTPRFTEGVRGLLARNAGRWKGRVVFPANDPALLALASVRDDLPEYRFAAPSLAVAQALLRRDTLRDHARALGIATPYDYGPVTPDAGARADLQFPVLLEAGERRPFATQFGGTRLLVRDRDGLQEAVALVLAAGLTARLVDFVPGGDDACCSYAAYLDARGAETAGLGMRTLRKGFPEVGPVCVAALSPDESLRDATVALLRGIGYRGLAYAEYKRDPRDGMVRLLGVDGRPFPTIGLARRAGVDLIRLAWEEGTGAPFGPSAYDGWRGQWIHLQADVRALLRHLRRGTLAWRDFARPYRGAKVFAVWSRADPGPFVAQWLRPLCTALGLSRSRPRRTIDP